jgi:hypothetical protein
MAIITYVKGEGKKLIDESSKLIPTLEKDGWKKLEVKKPELKAKVKKSDD